MKKSSEYFQLLKSKGVIVEKDMKQLVRVELKDNRKLKNVLLELQVSKEE